MRKASPNLHSQKSGGSGSQIDRPTWLKDEHLRRAKPYPGLQRELDREEEDHKREGQTSFKVLLEIWKLLLKIGRGPEMHLIETLSDRADQSLHERMRQKHTRHGFNLRYLQNAQMPLPLVKTI